MATASGSSVSHRFPKRLRPDLPLIPCGKCCDETKIVMEQCSPTRPYRPITRRVIATR